MRFVPRLIVLAVLALAACANTHEMAKCQGPMFPLNAGLWQPQQTDLQP